MNSPQPCDFRENDAGSRRPGKPIACTCLRCRRTVYNITALPVHRRCTGPPGLGDLVHLVLKLAGIRGGRGCGCQKRQQQLNRAAWRVFGR
jgi:hypothetical protein